MIKFEKKVLPSVKWNRRKFIAHGGSGGLGVLLSSALRSDAMAQASRQSMASHTVKAGAAFDKVVWNRIDGAKHIVGFNYQPTWGATGTEIWLDKFDEKKYRAEMVRGKELFPLMNTVRLWLSWGAWKKEPDVYIANLRCAFQICRELDLLMIPTLFTVWKGRPRFDPLYEDYIKVPFGQFEQYIAATISACPGNVLTWDWCNEPFPFHVYSEWLTRVASFIRREFPGNRTTIGESGVYNSEKELRTLFDICDLWSIHPYDVFISKRIMAGRETGLVDAKALNQGNIEQKKLEYLAAVGKHLRIWQSLGLKKPIVASECCWGSMDDEVRSLIVEGTLEGLVKLGVGFLPHALHTSPVADLHPPELGPVLDAGYMAFIRQDGSLRPGHDIFNKYALLAVTSATAD
jgi:hypothetical protein